MKNSIKAKGNKSFEIKVGVLIFQEEDSFLAYCPALNLSTYGESIPDVKEAFEDLIKSYAENCERMGTLEKDLIAHGWMMTSSSVEPPKEFDLNIPAGMLRKTYNESLRIPMHSC